MVQFSVYIAIINDNHTDNDNTHTERKAISEQKQIRTDMNVIALYSN